MKLKKVKHFKPHKKSIQKAIRKPQANDFGFYAKILINALVLTVLGILMFSFGFKICFSADQGFKQNCHTCSVFNQKDCNMTLMDEQEYGSGPCGDLGTYEMAFKIGGGIGLLGLFIILIGNVSGIWSLYKQRD
jgi:hypothetical protein